MWAEHRPSLCSILVCVPEYQVVFGVNADIPTSALLNMHTYMYMYMYAFVSVIDLGLFYLV